jgi:hypothetical protein
MREIWGKSMRNKEIYRGREGDIERDREEEVRGGEWGGGNRVKKWRERERCMGREGGRSGERKW